MHHDLLECQPGQEEEMLLEHHDLQVYQLGREEEIVWGCRDLQVYQQDEEGGSKRVAAEDELKWEEIQEEMLAEVMRLELELSLLG
jgi:hypothetical protein